MFTSKLNRAAPRESEDRDSRAMRKLTMLKKEAITGHVDFFPR
jgi:hypothetical protein